MSDTRGAFLRTVPAWAVALSVLIPMACGGARSSATRRREPPPPLLRHVAPGAGWILEARPDALWAASEVRRALAGSIAEGDLAEHADRTGVDVRRVEEAVAAGFGDAVAWTARGELSPTRVEALLRARLYPIERDDAPAGLVGVLGARRVRFRRLGPRAVAFGDAAAPSPKRAGPGVPAVAPLAARLGDAPLRFFYLQQLELPAETGAGMLLSRIERIGVGVTPSGGMLTVRIVLQGELPPTAQENLRALVDSLGESPLGRAFGADRAAGRGEVTVGPRGADLVLAFDPADVDMGVRSLFIDDLRSLFGAG